MPRRVVAFGLAIEAIFLVATLGPFSLLAHGTELTDLGKLTDHQPLAAVLVTVGLIVLFALYGAALLGISKGGARLPVLPIALGFTALFSLTLIFLYPVTAIDVYNYAVEGHVAVYHQINPMVNPPSLVTGDTFISYSGSWADSPSPYGPVWILLTELDALVAGSNVVLAILLLKALAAIAVVATAYLLAVAVRDRGPLVSGLAVILFGWNPLVQLEMVGNGHNDAVMTLLLIGGLVLLARSRLALGALGIGLSVLIKFLTLGAVPLFLLASALDQTRCGRARFAQVAASVAVLIGVGVISYLPFWAGPDTLNRALAADGNYLSSIPALVLLIVPESASWLVYPRLAILAIVGLWQANSLRRGRASLAQAIFEVLFATILIASHFAGWYLALLVAMAGLTRDRGIQVRMVVFTFTTTLTTPLWAYLWAWNQGSMSLTAIHLIVVPLIFLPALVIAFLSIWRRRGAPRRERDHPSYVTVRSAVGSRN